MTNIADSTDLWFDSALLPDGWANDVHIRISGGLIAGISPNAAPPAASTRRRIALPGLPNVHSHAFQRGMSGLTEFRHDLGGDSFWSWRDLLYRFVDRGDPDDIEAITALAFAEMLEGGFTRVAEFHYLHHAPDGTAYDDPAEMSARIAAAAEETGIGLTLLPVFYAHAGFGGQDPLDGQRRFLNSPSSFAGLIEAAGRRCASLPDALVGTAPHSLRAITPGELAEIAAMHPQAPIHIHIAEQEKEVEDCIAWSGARPVQWLLSNGDVDSRWCLIHATHTTPDELKALATTGAVVGLCPVTEANLGDGIFNGPDWLAGGGQFGVGSDSNVSISAADELRMLEYSQRLRFRQRNVMNGVSAGSTGRALFDAALTGGAQASGVTGGLRAGQPADIVGLDPGDEPAEAVAGDRVLDTWIFRRGNGLVSDVWRRGKHVVENGRHFARSALEARFAAALRRLAG